MPMYTEDPENTVSQEPIQTPSEVEEEKKEINTNIPEVEIVVEDGTGVSNSNTYCDLDFALEYCISHGYSSWNELTEEQQKIALIKGTEYIDSFFEWKGLKRSESQALEFPRVNLFDNNRFEVKGIPVNLKKACIEAAFLNSTSENDTLYSTKDSNGNIKRQKVDTLEVEYFENSSKTESSVDYTTIYDVLNKLLKGLYKTKDSNGSVCTRVIQTGW